MLLESGMVIRETYEIERFLGEGAFAEVYRVRHRFLGRQAIKVFKRPGMNMEDIQELLGEAILLSKIGHPNIVRVFDANTLESQRGPHGYFTMENVSGGSLQKFWQSHGNRFVPLETTLDLIKQVCRGMAVAHAENPPIVHRDIKPQNILVGYETDGLRARVGDFGLAKKVNPLTLLATTAGTLGFKPPEAFSDSKSDSPATDVWAIGATLYLLLTDRLPLDIQTPVTERSEAMLETPIVPPSRINPDAGRGVDEIVMKSLSKQPNRRYANASLFLQDLERLGTGVDVVEEKAVTASTSESSKLVFGAHTAGDEDQGRVMSERALELSERGRLAEAADLMEEAFNRSVALREKFESRVKLWRRGISM